MNKIACLLAYLFDIEAHCKVIVFNCNRKFALVFPNKSHEFIGNVERKKVLTKKYASKIHNYFQMLLKSVLRTGIQLVNFICMIPGR